MNNETVLFNVKNYELLALSQELCNLFESMDDVLQDESLRNFFAELSALGEKMQGTLSKDKFVSNLSEADQKRDEEWRRTRKVVQGFAANALPDIAQHGEALLSIVERAGAQIAYKNTLEESGELRALKTQFEQPEMQEHISALPGMQETLDALFSAEDAFFQESLEATKKRTEQKQQMTATELKKQQIALLNTKILPYLRVMSDVKPDVFAVFSRVVQKSVSKANISASQRRKKSAKKGDESEANSAQAAENESEQTAQENKAE